MRTKTARPKPFIRAPISQYEPARSPCFETADSTILRIPAEFLIQGPLSRDPQPQAARLSSQFINLNRGILGNFGITIDLVYDGNSVALAVKTSTRVGAIPLLSPTTGKPDYGLVIRPRFDWPGIGLMLVQMGWRVIPAPLSLPLLPRSERKIPAWVLSTIVLFRIEAMLKQLERRFEFSEADLLAPRGSVNWSSYISSRITSANFLSVPCRFPDLRDDRGLKSAIHFALRKQLVSLESQQTGGIIVLQLMNLCRSLLDRVRDAIPRQPSPAMVEQWYRSPLKTEVFRNGLQAVEWTIENRGLAGLADLQGLPWIMSMEEFFEAWIETVIAQLAKRTGGILRVGRKRETVAPLIWQPPYLGSQKSLLPDLILEREEETIIVDAKYKSHWEEFTHDGWGNLEAELRERHRDDLLQILAYSTLFSSKRIVSCLVYPCSNQTWESLKSRGRLWHQASLPAGKRRIDLILTAVPMGSEIEETIRVLATALKAG